MALSFAGPHAVSGALSFAGASDALDFLLLALLMAVFAERQGLHCCSYRFLSITSQSTDRSTTDVSMWVWSGDKIFGREWRKIVPGVVTFEVGSTTTDITSKSSGKP